VRLLLAAMLVDVERRLSAAALGTAGLTMQQRLAVESTLRTNPLRTLTPYTLAKAAGLTADWFARRFAISYGCSPRTWIANQRLGMAARLLRETDLAVGDIARRLGYGRPEPFTRRFSHMFGCPPLTYRKRGKSPG
jgi:AraC-like DNA-binding protein